ncbi:MAG: hypothetical protein CMN30_30775 [Sandaracinus sp.]|nr:hypothetical protein [Sandaracinus sp.]|tara:strand:- start:3902 stop:4216 length:315 start_codon:yes stop_codon:yes gene_type:complete
MNRLAIRPLLRLFALVFVLGAAPSFAQETESPEGERATSFQSVTGPQVEDVPGGALMVGAYAVGWTLVLLYVGRLASLHRRNAAEVEALREMVAGAAPKKDPAP